MDMFNPSDAIVNPNLTAQRVCVCVRVRERERWQHSSSVVKRIPVNDINPVAEQWILW